MVVYSPRTGQQVTHLARHVSQNLVSKAPSCKKADLSFTTDRTISYVLRGNSISVFCLSGFNCSVCEGAHTQISQIIMQTFLVHFHIFELLKNSNHGLIVVDEEIEICPFPIHGSQDQDEGSGEQVRKKTKTMTGKTGDDEAPLQFGKNSMEVHRH